MIIAAILAIAAIVAGIVLLVIRRRNRIKQGLPVFHLLKRGNPSHWY